MRARSYLYHTRVGKKWLEIGIGGLCCTQNRRLTCASRCCVCTEGTERAREDCAHTTSKNETCNGSLRCVRASTGLLLRNKLNKQMRKTKWLWIVFGSPLRYGNAIPRSVSAMNFMNLESCRQSRTVLASVCVCACGERMWCTGGVRWMPGYILCSFVYLNGCAV